MSATQASSKSHTEWRGLCCVPWHRSSQEGSPPSHPASVCGGCKVKGSGHLARGGDPGSAFLFFSPERTCEDWPLTWPVFTRLEIGQPGSSRKQRFYLPKSGAGAET